jgi:hypothetical protein
MEYTDFQVVNSRSNGVLVNENRSKGIRLSKTGCDTSTKP